ncbi:DUF1836 domain-containing protein [Allofustis seminis]|uniref:DUF1836 domain-containing protein n=1 Tax=Allofustis seminis TaxID=166939 RepID=UPI00036D8A3D|nr:DUF1836 domain-containing protein [Allofustis seminis]
MNNTIEKIYTFKLPRWQQLPEQPLRSSQLVQYVTEQLRAIFIDKEEIITTTMIQNYVKWGIIPRPDGKKYCKEHIAKLIVVIILKKVLHIRYIKKGMELQLNIMDIATGYDRFCEYLEEKLQLTFRSIYFNKPYELGKIFSSDEEVGLNALAYSFALNLLANIIISQKGFKNIGGSHG